MSSLYKILAGACALTVLMAQAPPAPPTIPLQPLPAAPAPPAIAPLPPTVSLPGVEPLSAEELRDHMRGCEGGPGTSRQFQYQSCSAIILARPAATKEVLSRAFFKRGQTAFEMGHLDKADADLGQALILDASAALVWSERARVRFYLDKFDLALADAAQAIKLKSDLADAHYHRGNAYTGKRDFAKAIAAYTDAIKHNPRFAFAHADRGIAYLRLEKFDEAIADIEKSFALEGKRIPWAAAQLEEAKAARAALKVRAIALAALPKKKTVSPAAPTVTITATGNPAGNLPDNDLDVPVLTQRVALVIGNGQYAHISKLKNAEHDAKDVAEALKAAGYSVYGYPALNMTRQQMTEAIKAFQAAAAAADTAIVWYAGHGQEFETGGALPTNWVIPVDFSPDDDVWDGAVSLTRLMTAVTPARTLRLVVVDACRNNNISTGQRGARGFVVEGRSDMMVVYSTGEGKIANDGTEGSRNSPFAAAFLETFKKHPKADVRLFFGGVRHSTIERTKDLKPPQEPEMIVRLSSIDPLPLAP